MWQVTILGSKSEGDRKRSFQLTVSRQCATLALNKALSYLLEDMEGELEAGYEGAWFEGVINLYPGHEASYGSSPTEQSPNEPQPPTTPPLPTSAPSSGSSPPSPSVPTDSAGSSRRYPF